MGETEEIQILRKAMERLVPHMGNGCTCEEDRNTHASYLATVKAIRDIGIARARRLKVTIQNETP